MTVDQISISRFSIITRISPKALRYYDQKGLLVPAAKDNLTGYRYYTFDQLATGVKIKTLSLLEFDIDAIADYLEAERQEDIARIESLLKGQLTGIQRKISRLQKIETLLQERSKEIMKMALINPVIKEVPALRVLSKREQGSIDETIHRLTEELMATVHSPENQRHKVRVAGPFITICYGEEFDIANVDVEVAIPIAGPVEVGDPSIEVKRLPEARVLSAVHKGSHELLCITYKEMFDYMAREELEFQPPARELFLNNPHETPEEELMTEIQIPLNLCSPCKAVEQY